MMDLPDRVERWWPEWRRVPIDEWVESQETREAAALAVERFCKGSASAIDRSRILLGERLVEPLSLSSYEELNSRLNGKRGQKPHIHTFHWCARAVATLVQGDRCALDGCDVAATMLDHDHESGSIRGLVCPEHNSSVAAPSGTIDSEGVDEAGYGHMAPYLKSPPLGELDWLYVDQNGSFVLDA